MSGSPNPGFDPDDDEIITMAHGSGGKAMRDLIDELFVSVFDSDELALLEDQARFDIGAISTPDEQLAMTTDSYVVDPLFFPGGDIGTLAVTGTVNDLAVSGAKPLYLSCGMIIEEGLPLTDLRRIVNSMKRSADQAGIKIVTGDTKVVQRGSADKLFINTTGIGIIPEGVNIAADCARPGDAILINGYIGDHGAAIVDARGDMALENTIESDCQPLNSLISAMRESSPDIHCMRDATRGGMATVLCEFATASNVGITINESAIPLRAEVRGMCEILGLDPLYLANEGKVLAIVGPESANSVLAAMQSHPAGEHAAIIGEVTDRSKSRVVLSTSFGGQRVVDMLIGEQLPRIC